MTGLSIEAQRAYPASEREFEAHNYPTLESQIRWAKARVEAAWDAAKHRLADWYIEHAYACHRVPESDLHEVLTRMRNVHTPHINYYRAEARNWQAHLDKLLTEQRGRTIGKMKITE